MHSRPPRPSGGWPITSLLERIYPEEGRRPNAEHAAALAIWLDELAVWNSKIDLTAARDALELCDLMIADAGVVAQVLPPNGTVVDVGTGAGAPGLALALLRPDLRITLCEPLAKRTSFLRSVLSKLGRRDVEVVAGRGKDLVGRSWDTAMARATLSPPEWLELGRTLAPRVIVFLAKEPAPNGGGPEPRETDYVWPLTGAERTLAVYER